MNKFSSNEREYIATTLKVMDLCQIPVRDTFRFGQNADDYYSNGGWDGPRLFRIEWSQEVEYCSAKPNKIYSIPNLKHAAWDSYRVLIPWRFYNTGRRDHVIHECVHFLQCTTTDEDSSYISFNGSNWLEYASQHTELEAHLVQAIYRLRFADDVESIAAVNRHSVTLLPLAHDYLSHPSNDAALRLVVTARDVDLI